MQWLWILLALATVVEVGNAKPRKGKGSSWWGIAKAREPNNISPLTPGVLFMEPENYSTLRRKQKRLARENPGVLVAVAKGAKQAIQECQFQFKDRQWNCSTRNFLRGKNLFGKIVDKGCRETAFIYAITSAAVTHFVARACAEGTVESCTCDYSHHVRGAPSPLAAGGGPGAAAAARAGAAGVKDWEWGGCSDNVGYGFAFSREFVDTGERGRNFREKMNLHNNEAGRVHVQSKMKQECKCHGMSGSCTVKTCWMRLAPFRTISDILKKRFDGASRILVPNSHRTTPDTPLLTGPNPNSPSMNSIHSKGHNIETRRNRYNFHLTPHNPAHKAPGPKDLVYLESSPPFCDKNSRFGILGTRGRECNNTSMGEDGCELLCCGRGVKQTELVVKERCSCTFHWCCEVKCRTCRIKKKVFTCL